LVRPGVKFKPIERNALDPEFDLRDVRSYFRVEAVAIHTKVCGCISKP